MDKDELEKILKDHSVREVAQILGCSPTNIRYWMRKLGVRKNQRHLYLENGMKKCPRCQKEKPLGDFYKRKDGVPGSWCRGCMRHQTAARQQECKRMAVFYKGGKCVVCGFNGYLGALDFHHLDSATKDSKIAATLRKRMTKEVQEELDKCVLLCAICHRMVHAGIIHNSILKET